MKAFRIVAVIMISGFAMLIWMGQQSIEEEKQREENAIKHAIERRERNLAEERRFTAPCIRVIKEKADRPSLEIYELPTTPDGLSNQVRETHEGKKVKLHFKDITGNYDITCYMNTNAVVERVVIDKR